MKWIYHECKEYDIFSDDCTRCQGPKWYMHSGDHVLIKYLPSFITLALLSARKRPGSSC